MKSFILLDRSGSMASHWDETLGALNDYIRKMTEDMPKARLRLCTFDSTSFDVVRDDKFMSIQPVSPEECRPRGLTPLLDAIGRLDTLIKSPKRATIMILTDGAENNSREMNLASARAVIDRWRKAGYDVVFIGADFDAFGEASSLGIGAGQTLNASKSNMDATMALYSKRSKSYLGGKTKADVEFTDAERRSVE